MPSKSASGQYIAQITTFVTPLPVAPPPTFSAPLILLGRATFLTATVVPLHRPLYTLPDCAGFKRCGWDPHAGH